MGLLIPRRQLDIYSFDGDYDDDGKWVQGTVTPGTIRASVQPLKGREMEMLPENRRNSQSYNLFSDDKLRTVKNDEGDDNENPDIVIIENEQHEVFMRGNWLNLIISHYHYVVIKLDKDKEKSLGGQQP